ncbi:unnamed protein product [Hydatigera taeniaeformis]|uniref:Troponin C n=1 Tax=Hydatigena taeniaeformis TaxID=6205 RepID=A0A0R3WK24_HYDTA|nr:unnamed protein product [Hydatigera taeniaeformis]
MGPKMKRDSEDHPGSMPHPTIFTSPIATAMEPWKGSAYVPPTTATAFHRSKQGTRTNDEAFRVDIEVFSYRPMRTSVLSTHRPADQPTHCYRGNPGGGGLRVRRLRLSVHALSPLLRRQHRHWRYSDTTGCNSIRHILHGRKLYLNRVLLKMEGFKISDDQVRVATETFKKFDKRGQDKISTNDLGPAFSALKVSIKPDLLKEWADEVDDDATGFIDLSGFLLVYGKILQNEQDEEDLRQAFRVLDKNRRGEIDVDDLRWILKELGDDLTEEEIDEMIRDTDRDGSGFVDFDEFKKLMTSE